MKEKPDGKVNKNCTLSLHIRLRKLLCFVDLTFRKTQFYQTSAFAERKGNKNTVYLVKLLTLLYCKDRAGSCKKELMEDIFIGSK